jgi:hypothetical protein
MTTMLTPHSRETIVMVVFMAYRANGEALRRRTIGSASPHWTQAAV